MCEFKSDIEIVEVVNGFKKAWLEFYAGVVEVQQQQYRRRRRSTCLLTAPLWSSTMSLTDHV